MSKTITEFDGFRIKNALTTKKELAAAGKTPEEIAQGLGEALKLEGDKLKWLLSALEVVEGREGSLKRVVVYAVEEGKTAPSGAVQKEDKHFLAEYFYVPQKQERKGREGRDGDKRGGKRGGKRGKGRDGGRGGRGDRRPPRGPGAGDPAQQNAAGGAPGEKREKRGDRRPPRGPRPDRGPKPAGEQKPAQKDEAASKSPGSSDSAPTQA